MKQHVSRSIRIIQTLVLSLFLTQATSIFQPPGVKAAIQERTLSSGTADSTGARGAKWRKIPFTARATGQTTFRLSWTGVSDMRFQILRADNSIIGGNITASTVSPKTYVTNLTANANYSVTIWAYSGVGTYTMTVAEDIPDNGTPDTTAPTAPSNLRTTGNTTSSISLAWDASTDDNAVARYRIFRNDNVVGTVTSTTYTDTGLSPGTEYTYTVDALDAADNGSPLSDPLTVSTTTASPTSRPNIVVINLDDMRTDSMFALPKVKSWMESGGTNFPNATVATPSCCPSRASLMTGRYVHNNGQYNQNNEGANMNLMIQRYLRDDGYFTGHSGKFLHWLPLGTRAPHWDRWTYYKGGYNNVQMRWDDKTVSTNGYATTIAFDRSIEYLTDFKNRDDSKPFFIQIAPTAPHSPSTPEAKYATASVPAMLRKPSHSETDRSDKPSFVGFTNVTYEEGNSKRTAMHRALYSVDDQVDRFMKELQRLGELDNTMVIFTADNGYFFGEHGREGKFLPYYESVGVPFYIRWPGHVAAGATDARRISHVDITPTILAAANVTQNLAPVDGKDMLSGHTRPYSYSEYYYDTANGNYITNWASIQNDQFVYTEYYGTDRLLTSTPSFREYYDMVNDPYQMVNLLKDNSTSNDPDVNVLSAQLHAAKTCSASSCP